jgi:PAXNEB protein
MQQQGKAIRLLLYHPTLEVMSVALPFLLAHIRKESLPVVIMICTRPSSELRSWIQLSRTSDVVLRTEGFASRKQYPPPPEFRHLQGVLKVDKTTKKSTEIAALIYGFKRDRRKLHIPLLHIPPEDYAEGGGSVGAGGLRSGAGRRPTSSGEDSTQGAKSGTVPTKKMTAGMGCSSNISGSALDF